MKVVLFMKWNCTNHPIYHLEFETSTHVFFLFQIATHPLGLVVKKHLNSHIFNQFHTLWSI
jgi:hypothetical protein